MTFSIVARSDDGESWGVAVASKVLAVGSAVPAAAAGVGAVASQAMVNTTYKAAGLAQLTEGASAAEVIQRLTDEDEGRDRRQLGIVDREGRAATYTGAECPDYAGGRSGDNYAIQGNILESEEVVLAMQSAFVASDTSASLAERLMAALRAGQEAGGDARGQQSAAILVVKDKAGFLEFDDIEVELRVEDHPTPIDELDRILGVHRRLHAVVPEDERTPDTPELLEELDSRAQALGYRGQIFWMSAHNFEAYGGEDWTGTRVVEELRAATPGWKPETSDSD